MTSRFAALACISLALSTLMCSKDRSSMSPKIKSVTVELKLSGPMYQGTFYTGFLPRTDYGIWVVDADQKYVKTLKITTEAVSVGQYQHCDHLPAWMASSGITYAQLQQETGGQEGVAPSFDAISNASPYFAADSVQIFTCTWDLTDRNGAQVKSGTYLVFAEAANITKSDPVVYTIDAEHTSARIDLVRGTIESAASTANIRSLTATFNLNEAAPSAKASGTILGPN